VSVALFIHLDAPHGGVLRACVLDGRPSVAITNLVWDHVYKDYLALVPDPEVAARYRGMIDQMSRDYGCADAILRMPGASAMPNFRRVSLAGSGSSCVSTVAPRIDHELKYPETLSSGSLIDEML
jgi:hypothetical protein